MHSLITSRGNRVYCNKVLKGTILLSVHSISIPFAIPCDHRLTTIQWLPPVHPSIHSVRSSLDAWPNSINAVLNGSVRMAPSGGGGRLCYCSHVSSRYSHSFGYICRAFHYHHMFARIVFRGWIYQLATPPQGSHNTCTYSNNNSI